MLPDTSRKPSYRTSRDSEERRARRGEQERLPRIELRSGVPSAARGEPSSKVVVVKSLKLSVGGVGAALRKQDIDFEVVRAAMNKETGEEEEERKKDERE
jgi:hypothetical protein